MAHVARSTYSSALEPSGCERTSLSHDTDRVLGAVSTPARAQGMSTDGGAEPPPYSCIYEEKEPQNSVFKKHVEAESLVLIKCSCRSNWCPACNKRYNIPKQVERMRGFDYSKTRFVTLTLNRELVGYGEQAFKFSKSRKLIGRFIQKLRRTGITVEDWTCNLEWHKDGTPHWHLLIQVSLSGRAGQIGQELIHQCWPFGRVHETFFKTEKAFLCFLGYLGKTGYLHKDKHHQIELPPWAMGMKKINRFSSMRRPCQPKEEADSNGPDQTQKQKDRLGRSYQERHAACGQSTEIWRVSPDGSRRLDLQFNIPYREMVGMFDGVYVAGVGYVLDGPVLSLLLALERFQADNVIKCEPDRPGENGPPRSSSEPGRSGSSFHVAPLQAGSPVRCGGAE